MARSRILALAGTVVLLAAGVAVVVPALFGGHDHRLRAVFDEAVQIAPGQEVRVAGRKVGHVGSVEAVDGNAIVDLDISEGDVWPLRRGTTAAIRWGSTTSLAYRYIELDPGRAPAPDLPDGGALSRAHTITPVELDQAYRIFRGRTRGDLKTLVGELGDTLDGQGGALRRGLRAAPGGLDATSALLRELGDDQDALRTLMVSGDRVTSALSAHSAQLGDLVTHAAGTFDEFARHTRAEQAALSAAPRAFAAGTSTLKRFDGSLVGLRALVDDLAPGAKRLRTLATPARQALTELHSVVPLATSAFRSGRRAAPGLTRLLTTGTTFLPRLGPVLAQLDPMVGCLRPYGPELAGMFSTWTGYNKNYDAQGHYARTFPLQTNPALAPGTSQNSQQITDELKDRVNYAMPRPPGLNAGQPWFQPQCGAGPDSLDASKDPEGAGASR